MGIRTNQSPPPSLKVSSVLYSRVNLLDNRYLLYVFVYSRYIPPVLFVIFSFNLGVISNMTA